MGCVRICMREWIRQILVREVAWGSMSVSELLRDRWTHHHHLGWMCCTNTRDGSYLFFKGYAPPWGAPPPMGKAKIAEFFLSPTRCKGGGHSFCLIHTKFSALNILNAQNCWVIFQKLGLKTSLRHEPSNFNRSWEKSDLLKVIYISEFLTTFLKYPTI